MVAVPTLTDNYAYLAGRAGEAVVVDPGEAGPVEAALLENGWRASAVWVTHAHADHAGGCRGLLDRSGVQAVSPGVAAGERRALGTVCRAISTPGHVPVHRCFYFPEIGILFSGDVLINGGCGRSFSGSPVRLFESLRTLKALPGSVRVFGGHDYLLENLRFAGVVEPGNAAVAERAARYRVDPGGALFATLEEECRSNPFLRVADADAFVELRRRKDRFG